MGTGANMTLKNQTTAPFTSTLFNLSCMYQCGDDGYVGSNTVGKPGSEMHGRR